MRKALFTVIACISIITSYASELKQTPKPAYEPVSSIRCYMRTVDFDTVSLKLSMTGNEVVGDLTYKYFDKDPYKGTLRGVMSGDTLFAVYKFVIEGVESSTEVAFLKRGNDFVEGYANTEEENGVMVFTNKASLDFSNNVILKLVECGK